MRRLTRIFRWATAEEMSNCAQAKNIEKNQLLVESWFRSCYHAACNMNH
jgi:hypothetical protein